MALDRRTPELAAIGASVAANCQSCLEYHVGKARGSGAEAEEITGAVEVGRAVRRSAAATVGRFAAGLGHAAPSPAGPPAKGRGCGS